MIAPWAFSPPAVQTPRNPIPPARQDQPSRLLGTSAGDPTAPLAEMHHISPSHPHGPRRDRSMLQLSAAEIFHSPGTSGAARLPSNLVSIFAWSSAILITSAEPGCPPSFLPHCPHSPSLGNALLHRPGMSLLFSLLFSRKEELQHDVCTLPAESPASQPSLRMKYAVWGRKRQGKDTKAFPHSHQAWVSVQLLM